MQRSNICIPVIILPLVSLIIRYSHLQEHSKKVTAVGDTTMEWSVERVLTSAEVAFFEQVVKDNIAFDELTSTTTSVTASQFNLYLNAWPNPAPQS